MASIGSAIGGMVAKVAASPDVKRDVSEVTQKVFRSASTEFNKTDVGKSLGNLFGEYHRQVGVAETQIGKDFPSASSSAIHSHAKNLAREKVFGEHDSLAVAHITHAQEKHGLFYAQNLADHAAMILNDEKLIKAPTAAYKGAPKTEVKVSKFKKNVVSNKGYADMIKTDSHGSPIDWSSVRAKNTPLENSLRTWAMTILSPAIAIPHIGTPIVNLALSTPLKSLAKGIYESIGSGDMHVSEVLLKSGALGESTLSALRANEQYKNGDIRRLDFHQQPVAYLLNRVIHQPGFTPLRKWTVHLAAATGYHTAIDSARIFAETGSKRHRIELEEMGLRPEDILRQKGELSAEQLEQAVYHFTDNKVFLDNSMSRSYYAQKNGYARLGSMYHGYISRQGKFMAHELKKSFRTGNPMAIIQTLAVLGVVAPITGQALEELERYSRLDFSHSASEDFANLSGANGISKMSEQYIEALSHIAAFGVGFDYVRSAARGEIAKQAAGPIGNMIFSGVEDTAKETMAGWKFLTDEDHPTKQFAAPSKSMARDILGDILPDNTGRMISHQFVPTQAEERRKEKLEEGEDPEP
jgi:hypothetical protein